MKKFILPFCAALFLIACSSKKQDDTAYSRQILMTDTLNLNASNVSTDIAAPAPEVALAPQRPQVVYVDRYISAPAPRRVVKQVAPAAVPVVETPVPVATPAPAPVVTTPDVAVNTPIETSPVENKKKGISDAAKGAAIGGIGGAIAGAVIGKNAKGAALGGVIGAAGGYILGRAKDKKSGRIELGSN